MNSQKRCNLFYNFGHLSSGYFIQLFCTLKTFFMSHLCDSSRRHYTWSSSLSEVMPSETSILITRKSWLWTSLYPLLLSLVSDTPVPFACPIHMDAVQAAWVLGIFPWDLTVNPKYHSGTMSSPVSAKVLCQVLSVPCCPDVVQSERASAQGPTEIQCQSDAVTC